jgi:hypothetical protein
MRLTYPILKIGLLILSKRANRFAHFEATWVEGRVIRIMDTAFHAGSPQKLPFGGV